MSEGNFYFYTTLLFSFTSIITILMYYFSNVTCPSPRIISRTITSTPVPTIDLQFSETNFPSVTYDDVFKGNNVWQGGYNLDSGKSTQNVQNGLSTRPVVSNPGGHIASG
jgi:hypothetical protein